MENSLDRFSVTRRSNFIHRVLTKLEEDPLKKFDIYRCETCKGLGLGNCEYLDTGGYTWDGHTYCPDCAGTGFSGYNSKVLQINDTEYICKHCFGEGCKKCNHKGILDWVEHCMGK